MKSLIERETLTVDEAAKILGIGRNKAYEAVQTGEIPSLRFGSRIVVPRKSIDMILGSAPHKNQPAS
jgi:excisionase family DNA binding protein